MEEKIINNRYKVISSIGSGGNASVFLAYDMINKHEVAVKILNISVEDKESPAYKKFNQELMTMATFDHKNISKIYDYGVDNEHPFVVMEYIKGTNFSTFIKEREYLLIDEVEYYMSSILDAVGYMHSLGIIHQDLKPQNMIVKYDGTIVLIDFGTALFTEDAMNLPCDENRLSTTIHYMAYDLVQNRRGSIQTDIYALGISMFEMITGRLPFVDAHNDHRKMINMHKLQKLPDIKDIMPTCPQGFIDIVNKACDKDPKKRYKNAYDFKQDLLLAYDKYKNPEKYKKRGLFSFFKKR